jgi:hypothetical protein
MYPATVDAASLGALFNIRSLHILVWAACFGTELHNAVVGVTGFKALRASPLPLLLLLGLRLSH